MRPCSCTGAVLAGGESSRYQGTHKGLLALGNRRVIDWVLEALTAVSDDVLIVANDPAIHRALPGIPVYVDAYPQRASIVGLYSAILRAPEAALAVAWDMPFLSVALLRELRRIGDERGVAVFPEGPGGPEPLCAYYPASSVEVIHRQIASGSFRLGALVDALTDREVVPLTEVARFGDPEWLFMNVNSPRDLEAAADWLRRGKHLGQLILPCQ
jgi:molybdopterin-guanine dinucleotide biosynthesis protein A